MISFCMDLSIVPDEIVETIISHVSRITDLKSVSLVSGLFYDCAIFSLWTRPKLSRKLAPDNLRQLAHLPIRAINTHDFMRFTYREDINLDWVEAICRLDKLTSLQIGPLYDDLHKNPTPEYLMGLICLTNVRTLIIDFDVERGYADFLGIFFQCFPLLEELYLNGQTKYVNECSILTEYVCQMDRLKKLALEVTDEVAPRLAKLWNLRQLTVSPYTSNVNMYQKASADSIRLISDSVSQLRQLRKLQLSMVCREACGEMYLCNLPRLERLMVHGFEIKNMEAACMMISDISTLTELELSHLNATGAAHLSKLKRLSKFIFTGTSDMLAGCLPHICQIGTLETVTLAEVDGFDLKYMRDLTRLRELDVTFTDPYPKCIGDSLSCFTELRKLSIANCTASHCSRLRKLTHLTELQLTGAVGDLEKLALNVSSVSQLHKLTIETNETGCQYLTKMSKLKVLCLMPTEFPSENTLKKVLTMKSLTHLELALLFHTGNAQAYANEVCRITARINPGLELFFESPGNIRNAAYE